MDTSRLLHRALVRLQDLILRYPERVLAASAALGVAAIFLGAGIELRTSRSDLAPPDDPDQIRFEQVAAEYQGLSDLIACVEAAPGESRTPDELRAFSDALADRFRSEPAVAQVFHRIDLEWFAARGLWFVPPGTLARGVAAIRGETEGAEALASLDSLAALNGLLAARLESGLNLATPPPEEEALAGLQTVSALLTWERGFLDDPEESLASLESGFARLGAAGDRPELASGGYLSTRDGTTLFMLVSPSSDDDSLPVLRELVRVLRRAADEVIAARPGFRVAFTGEPAMVVEEMDAVRTDTWVTSAFSAAGVIILTLFVFRWRAHSILVLAALAVGITWSIGAVRLELGYLNMLTSSFISTLVGVGVAYAIHPVSEYELQGAHTVNPKEAVRAAYRATGAAVTTGGVTTAAAFFSILLMRFRGFSELGLVAGVGIVLCLVAALVTLPAILEIYGRWRHRRDRSARAAAAAVDRLWVERGAGRVCAFPKTTTAASIVLTIVLVAAAMDVSFDTSMLNLLPRKAESLRYLRKMIAGSDLSPSVNIILADDLEALRVARDRAGQEPTISRFDSALQFLPEDPAASRAALAGAATLLDGLRLPATAAAQGREPLAGSLRRLEAALASAADASFSAGLGGLAGPLEDARALTEEMSGLVAAAPEERAAAWTAGEARLLAWAHRALEDLRAAARAPEPTIADLPDEIRDRFVTRNGRFVALLHASDNIFDTQFLEEYVAASRRASQDVTGFPLVFRTMSGRITSGFNLAATMAAVLVFLILLADFRKLRESGLALVPLAMGVAWMMGGMRVLGLSFNFANLVAVPLIIGVGIDNGVHVIHRVRLEGDKGMTMVLRHTGRAILIASLTTMVGFGSLCLASHRGLASLGTILLLGVGACLVTSMVVLPNMLVAFGLVRR